MLLIDDEERKFIAIVNEKGQYLKRDKYYNDCNYDRFVDTPLGATEFYAYNDGDEVYDAEYYTGQMNCEFKTLTPVIMKKSELCSVYTTHPKISKRPKGGLAAALEYVHKRG